MSLQTAKNSRELIKGTFAGEKFDRIPIWFMRQAGRYLPEYMVLKDRYTFEERCQNPEIAKEITIQPIHRFDLDAAVIFSDILIPIYGMDRGLSIVPFKGPVIEKPLKSPEDAINLVKTRAKENFPYQSEAIKLVRKELPGKAIVGFAGAPFTLASYLIEGKSTRDGLLTKSFAIKHPKAFNTLLYNLTDIIIDQLRVQVDAGADFLQIFDSWVGHLSPIQFDTWAIPHLRRIFSSFTDIPVIFYARGSSHLFPRIVSTEIQGINVDHTLTLTDAHNLAPRDILLQGNLDPAYLLSTPDITRKATLSKLEEITSLNRFNYIFNLSSGINKDSGVDNVVAMVDTVQSYRRT